MSRADLWEAGADEREQLSDEREQLSDERERLADEREALADDRDRSDDRHDHQLDRRDSDPSIHVSAAGELADAAEVAAAQAALSRAETGARRAEARLVRARENAARVAAHAARRGAASARATATHQAEQITEAEEAAWLVDRRDFVAAEREDLAAEREDLAAERDTIADQRDEMAGLRERFADDRERRALERERRIDQRGRPGDPAGLPGGQPRPLHADRRADTERQRQGATARRRSAAQERSRTGARWGPEAYGPTLVASFAELARQLFGSEGVADVVPPVLKFTTGVVAGCDWASVTLWRHGHVVDVVSSDAVAAELDDIQFGTGIGPATAALQSENPIYVPDLAGSPRWPVVAATAAQLGVASSLSHGLFVHQPAQWSPLGTFSLYSATPDAFSHDDQEFGSILAAYLAVGVAMVHRRDEVDHREAALHRGLSTRDVIGQAKGILMERQRLSAGDAFDLLRRASQRLNRRLVDVAEHLTETGEIPD